MTHAINPFNFTSYVPQTSAFRNYESLARHQEKKNDEQRVRAAGACVSYTAPFTIISLLRDIVFISSIISGLNGKENKTSNSCLDFKKIS